MAESKVLLQWEGDKQVQVIALPVPSYLKTPQPESMVNFASNSDDLAALLTRALLTLEIEEGARIEP